MRLLTPGLICMKNVMDIEGLKAKTKSVGPTPNLFYKQRPN